MNTIQITPEQRNEAIDSIIKLLIYYKDKGYKLSICSAMNYPFIVKYLMLQPYKKMFDTLDRFYILNIPVLGRIGQYWWEVNDLDSRVLFLKSIKTC